MCYSIIPDFRGGDESTLERAGWSAASNGRRGEEDGGQLRV